MSVEKTKISKRIQRFLVQRGGGGGRKGERKSQFSTESSSRVSKKAPEVADDSSLSLSLSLSSRARKKRGRDLNSKRICLGKKKNSRVPSSRSSPQPRVCSSNNKNDEKTTTTTSSSSRERFLPAKRSWCSSCCAQVSFECLTRGLLRKNYDAFCYFFFLLLHFLCHVSNGEVNCVPRFWKKKTSR